MLHIFVHGATHHFVGSSQTASALRVDAIFLTQNLPLLMQCSQKCITSVNNKEKNR